MENSPITLLHWHTEPALIGGILLVGWAYSLFMGPYREEPARIHQIRSNTLFGFQPGWLPFTSQLDRP